MLPPLGFSGMAIGVAGADEGGLISVGLSTITVSGLSDSISAAELVGLVSTMFKLSSEGTFLTLFALFIDWVDGFLRTWSVFGTKEALLAMAGFAFPFVRLELEGEVGGAEGAAVVVGVGVGVGIDGSSLFVGGEVVLMRFSLSSSSSSSENSEDGRGDGGIIVTFG